jgi:hypothetical protein
MRQDLAHPFGNLCSDVAARVGLGLRVSEMLTAPLPATGERTARFTQFVSHCSDYSSSAGLRLRDGG